MDEDPEVNEAAEAAVILSRCLIKLGFLPRDVFSAIGAMFTVLEHLDQEPALRKLTRLSQEYGLDDYRD